jgi:membrane-associated PAP2 superfamily phosphatase
MSNVESSPKASRTFDFRIAIAVPLAAMALLLMFDPSPLDFAVSSSFYLPGIGFVARHSFWLENVLHGYAKDVLTALAVGISVCWLLSLLPNRLRPKLLPWRRELGYVVLAIALSTSVVVVLKPLTEVHCPWSLTQFGGQESYTRLFEARVPTDRPGRCWPSGHASTGFSLFALFFALRDRKPRWGRVGLATALVLGVVFSFGRIAQGAHFLSHNIWTMLLDWLICVLSYRWLLYRSPRTAGPLLPARATREIR